MCGIVGLLIKNAGMREQLGALAVPMMLGMTERGPDSAGLALFTGKPSGEARKMSLLWEGAGAAPWTTLVATLERELQIPVALKHQEAHGLLTFSGPSDPLKTWIGEHNPQFRVLSLGRSMELYKDVGTPAAVTSRYRMNAFSGTHLVGHTRMATESAVTPGRAHPFTAGEDFCLVHNGSLSNPNEIRRALSAYGIAFETDNDTEAACRFLEWRLREGDDLEKALQAGFERFDGFYTFLMGTASSLALIRDPFGCKPAVVAETADYVAIASEFHALAHLPDIKNAQVFEPIPEEMYVWTV